MDRPAVLLTLSHLWQTARQEYASVVSPRCDERLHPNLYGSAVHRVAAYRPMLSVDIERSAGRGDAGLLDCREVLFGAVRSAAELSGLDWSRCTVSRHGDMLRLIAPPGTDKARLIHPLLQELSHELRQHNRRVGCAHEVRVRAAIHAGEVYVDDGEVVGHPLELLARMLEASPLREALAAAPKPVTVALLVSEHVYDDTVRQGHRGIDPDTYLPVQFTVKETVATGWLRAAGSTATVSAGVPDRESTTEGRNELTIRQNVGGHAHVDSMIGSQVNNGTWVGRVAGDAAVGPTSQVTSQVVLDGLADLRHRLDDSYRSGNLDESTFAEADAELRTAEDEAVAPSDTGWKRLVLALMKLRGLVFDITDLGTRVTTLITSVRDL